MTYTIRLVRLRQFIEPGLGVSTYLDFGARLFSRNWPPYGAHILQGLLSLKLNPARETVPLQISDMGKKTVSVLEHKFFAAIKG